MGKDLISEHQCLILEGRRAQLSTRGLELVRGRVGAYMEVYILSYSVLWEGG